MKFDYLCNIRKYLRGTLEIPDNLLEGKDKMEVCCAAVVQHLQHLKQQGYYILEDEIEIYDTDNVQSGGDELSSKHS